MARWNWSKRAASSTTRISLGIRRKQPLWHGRIHRLVCFPSRSNSLPSGFLIFLQVPGSKNRALYLLKQYMFHLTSEYVFILHFNSGNWNAYRRLGLARIRQRHSKYLLGKSSSKTHRQRRTLWGQTLGIRKRDVRCVDTP